MNKSRKRVVDTNNIEEKRVDFLVVGTQKGGTSALDSCLRLHPDICMANKKELHFFDRDECFANRNVDYKAYHSYFNPLPSQRLLGESTPAYMYMYEAPKRIWEYNPDIKLIIVLRNPIDRAYSHWNMQRERGWESRSFWEAIHNENEKTRESLPFQNRPYSYVSRGFYTEQIRRLWFYFSETQTLILKSEALLKEQKECLRQISSFLGVDNFGYDDPVIEHLRSYNATMTDREREHLYNLYEYEIKQLERMLNWDCSAWFKA